MEKRTYATYEIEEEVWARGYEYVAGTDEVGRGCGAGPVVAAAVIIPKDYLPKLVGRIKDSKKLSEAKREGLYTEIIENCAWGVGSRTNHVIDDINILEATKEAMREAVLQLKDVDYALVDGTVRLYDLFCQQRQVIRGDSKSISIAAASIVAKVIRDEGMRTLHWIYPQYGWIRNKGYLTKEHCGAIQTYGTTPYHRMSFKKVGK
jgi:ribonuclease HII